MKLLDLGEDILVNLPAYLRNIEDFLNAAATCKDLHRLFNRASPRTVLHLAHASAPTFFHPHPYYLVAGTARRLGEWTSGHEAGAVELADALQGGIDGLYQLCLHRAGLTLDDIRRLHLQRFDVINPLSDQIDKMAGQQWYATPNFWNGGVSEAYTLYTEADRAAFQLIIYGELFGPSMNAYLASSVPQPSPGLQLRLDYIRYCVPDSSCQSYPGFAVEKKGPYACVDRTQLPSDQVSLRHIVNCNRWKRLWEPVMQSFGPDFTLEWKTTLWWNAVQMQGLEGMEMVTKPDGILRWRERLEEMRRQVEAKTDSDRPSRKRLNLDDVDLCDRVPNLPDELYTCMRSYFGPAKLLDGPGS